ncbi:MAG: 3-dehydroquinate synthase [Pseudomonadales bacterium]|nr:3-dehydroquinate synthase [Pseudomonadales bacterium]
MEVIELELADKSYPIYIGSGLMSDQKLIQSRITGERVLIVTNETIAPLYLDQLKAALDGLDVDSIELPDGEQYKTLDTLNSIFDILLKNNHNRNTTIIALGGGVTGDTAGFAAASYQRGVAFLQIPTTLLAQVDSSVGGKTAVNHALGKNMIGAFYQPQAVIIDTESLSTLPKRQLAAGLAEVIKHGAMADRDYFDWLEQNLEQLLALDTVSISKAVKGSCSIKAAIVAADEKETGIRALLNFGHTFGHAIENGLGYGEWLHGEAVAAGMVMAADLSCRLGMLDPVDGQRLKNLIKRAGLPVAPPAELQGQFMTLMQRDKKVSDKGLRFVLLDKLGKARLVEAVDEEKLQQTLAAGAALVS